MMATDVAARRAVLTGFAIQGLTFSSIVTRLATIKDKFDLDDLDVLLLLAAVAALSAVGSIVAGYTAQRWGSAATLRVALAGASLGSVLPGLAGSLPALVACTCVYGFFVGGVDAALNMQGVAVQDRYGRSIMTGFHAMWSIAAVVGAGYAALTIALDWPLFASLAVVCLVGLAANALTGPDLLRTEPASSQSASGPSPTHRVPWLPVILIGIPTFAMWVNDSATSVWSGIYLQDGLDAAAYAAPAAYGAYQAVLLVVRLVGDRLVGRYGATAVVRVSGIVAVAALVVIVAAPSVYVVVIGFALLGGGLSLVPPLSYVAAGHLDREGGTTAIARVNVANYLGYLVAAFAIAFTSDAFGERYMFVLPLLVAVVLPVMARQFEPRTRSAPVP
ncbi:MFS transporter [Nocardioidaceae bacterium SCSIO 66511]|nr:MFS transporter [Nocardioidaceae bacterium SCSIO 66511]